MSDGVASFNFNEMLQGLERYVTSVKSYLSQLERATGGTVSLGTMFQLQFRMQIMSQFVEACSNTLTAVHQEMLSMAKATKGQ